MRSIQIIEQLNLTRYGLQVKDESGKMVPLHFKQGELGGACAVYSLMMAMLSIGYLKYSDVMNDDDNTLDRRSPKGKMISHFLEQQGMVRDGYNLFQLSKEIRQYCADLFVKYHRTNVLDIISDKIYSNHPIIAGISGKGFCHAILIVGLEDEHDDEQQDFTTRKLFCLDPGYELVNGSYWNRVINVEKELNGEYKYWSLTKDGAEKINLDDIIRIEKLV